MPAQANRQSGSTGGERRCKSCRRPCKSTERTCSRCRQRRRRARLAAERPTRPVWSEGQTVAAALALEPLATLEALMADPPHGPLTGAMAA